MILNCRESAQELLQAWLWIGRCVVDQASGSAHVELAQLLLLPPRQCPLLLRLRRGGTRALSAIALSRNQVLHE